MVLALAGFASVAASEPAVAGGVRTTVNSVVGHSKKVVLGVGPTFGVASCASASPSVVGCGTLPARHPVDVVQLWCLAPTSPSGVAVTVDFVANGLNAALPPATLTVNCAAAPVPTLLVPGIKVSQPLTGASAVTSCTTNVVGATCTYSGKTITRICTVAVTLNTLPITVTATVTVDGPAAINGQTLVYYYRCG